MIEEKIYSRNDAPAKVQQWKAANLTVVFTNGCFDLIHAGHVRYLEQARALGDKLVVGLNDDSSVTALKGPQRPIQKVTDRAAILAAFESVDMVVVFSELTTDALLQELRPDIMAKGGDYTMDTLVASERDFVLSYGGKIEIIPHMGPTSTTRIVQKIRGD